MKERTLLDVMENIDDGFIEEAAHPEILLRKKKLPLSPRKLGTIAACMVIAFGLLLAVPYMRVSPQKEVCAEDMNALIQSALAEQSHVYADKEASLISSAVAGDYVQTSQNAALDSSLQAEMERVTSSVMSSPLSPESNLMTRDEASDSIPAEPQINLQRIGEITFGYSEDMLLSAEIDKNHQLTDLVIPENIDGLEITKLSDDFWTFCHSHPSIRTVTVPKGIESFGNVEPLKKTVEIICTSGSPAERFFTEKGYTVRVNQP